jgi:hypothetical protein
LCQDSAQEYAGRLGRRILNGVTGQWAEPSKRADGDVAALTVDTVRPVTAPANPYE